MELALTNAKAKNTKAVKALLDLSKIDLDGDTVKGLDDQIKQLAEAEDSKFLFGTSEGGNKPPGFKGIKPGEKKDGALGTEKPSTLSDAIKMHFVAKE